MSGQVGFVTGSAVGIGRALAINVAKDGGAVIALDVDDKENAETKRLVEAAGGTCHAIHCDVGDRLAVEAVFNSLPYDHIDILINNSAVWNDTSLTAADPAAQTDAFETAMGACVMGAYYCTVAAVPLMSPGSNIINILTDHVKEDFLITGAPATGYDAAKFGLLRLTESWAVELKDRGIRVNGLCFGATDTPMLRGVSVELAEKGMKPEDIALAVDNVVGQGPDGETGKSYLFGLTRQPREKSLEQIEGLKAGKSL